MASLIKWLLPSVLVAGGLTAVAGALTFRSIVGDVTSRATAELKTVGQDWAMLSVHGRDLVLSGVAPEPRARDLALSATEPVFGVRVVDDATSVLPLSEPFTFAATRDGPKITLEGSVPNDSTHAAILAAVAATVPGAEISDHLTSARGAGGNFGAASVFALGQLGGLTKGRVALSDSAYSIAGDPADWETYRKLEAQLVDALPAGLKLAADTLVAPVPRPYRVTVTVGGAGIAVDGFLPDVESRARLVAAVKSTWHRSEIEDHVVLAPGAPAGFVAAILAALPDVARLSGGSLDLSDGTLKLTGGVPTAAFGEQVVARLRARLPQGVVLGAAELMVSPPAPVAPDACRAGLGAVQANGAIRFETGSAELDLGDIRVLDDLVVAALRCGTSKVVVVGHTDNVGDADANRALSERRAAAVVDHLVAAGLSADRLSAQGYGDTRPIGDNATEEGRQMNRRIEFSVE